MCKINRKELVARHKIIINELDKRAPLTVGNGRFGFTADITGLQTFPSYHRYEQPLCTLAEWGWHSYPMPDYLKGKELKMKGYKTGARVVPYPASPEGQAPLYLYRRANPHRFHLGMIGFRFQEKTEISDICDIHQELDMYTGMLTSRFTVHGEPVEVKTCSMQSTDAVAVSVKSPLLQYGRMRIQIEFPYVATPNDINAAAAEYSICEGNKTVAIDEAAGFMKLRRTIDATEYYVGINYQKTGIENPRENAYELVNFFGEELSFVVEFSDKDDVKCGLTFASAVAESEKMFETFWEEGGIIDFGEISDPRARELESRMIKSLYIARINMCSETPPCESGFTCNSGWWGKSHLEMHYWHSAHFATWNRPELCEITMRGYLTHMDMCKAIATRQGYRGIRIPKIIDRNFQESPSDIAPLLVWQQPHPTMLCELIYRANPDRAFLEKYFDLIEQTCEFMLDFLLFDEKTGKYNLDAPYIPAQEFHKAENVKNAVYELEYWHFALNIYKQWCQRLGRTPLADIDEKLEKLAPPPVIDGKYPAHENCPDTFENFNLDHPSMLCAYGVLPGWRMDENIVRNTLEKVLDCWQWDTTWGWDYALLSMCASKLGEPEIAVDILLKDTIKNTYGKNGHVYQYPGLPCYIDTNNSFLLALGFLAAGCDSRPGCLFPKDWNVKVEGILKHV